MSIWDFWKSDEEKLRDGVQEFPDRFERLKLNWVRLKMGLEAGLFSADERRRALNVYYRFPSVWEAIRPSWLLTDTGMALSHTPQFVQDVDTWVEKLNTELDQVARDTSLGQLGVLPVFIVAGLWIAGAVAAVGGAAAAVIAALAWFQEADTEQQMIEEVTAGRLSESVLKARYEAESSGGFFDNVESIVGLGLLTVGAILFGPRLLKMFSSEAEPA
jgi:hypothetical protein